MQPKRAPDPRSVLIVDDNDELRRLLQLLFESEGFTVVGEAGSGVGVLTMVLELNPAFVVLDDRMPRLNGSQTAEAIRLSAPQTCIVAFSAYLYEQPPWADVFLNKDRINQIASLLKDLVARNPESAKSAGSRAS